MNEVFLDLYKHHLWANLKLLETCEPLADDALDATAAGTYGCVRDTLVHLVASEARYLMRMTKRGEPEHPLKEGDFPGFIELKQRAQANGEDLLALAATTTANDTLPVDYGGQQYEIPISIFFAQAINHGTEHRSHVCTILTQQGVQPPNLDVWEYLRSGAAR
jgi:uncharacterized damage-inducible protein DinB